MPFLEDAEQHRAALPPDGVEAAILGYLLDHGVGRHNVQSWKSIDQFLRSCGFVVRQQAFQHGLLKASREGGLFIGASNQGYFLIETREDADVMRAWYLRRIEVERGHLAQLDALVVQAFGHEP